MAEATIIQTETTTRKALSEDSKENPSPSPRGRTNSRSKSPTQAQVVSISRKSDSGSSPHPRLTRTLKRNPKFHGLGEDDIKYLWVGYKKGIFSDIFKEGLSAKEFSEVAVEYMLTAYTHAWVLGETPVGVVFGINVGPFVYLGSVKWFPWATKRQISEHLIGFLNLIRKELNCVWDCTEEDKNFYEYIARHGIIRRVGTLHSNNHAKLWETR